MHSPTHECTICTHLHSPPSPRKTSCMKTCMLIVQLQGFVTQAAIVQVVLLTSIGNPSPITTCIQLFYCKLSNLLHPSVCIPAYQDCWVCTYLIPRLCTCVEILRTRLLYRFRPSATFFLSSSALYKLA